MAKSLHAAPRYGLLLAACAVVLLNGGAAEFTCPPAFYKRHASLIPIANGQVYIPVFRFIKGDAEKITLAMVVLHGGGQSSDNYFGWVVNSELAQHQKENAVVVMPSFPTFRCNASDWIADENQTGETLRWTGSSNWKYGQLSDPMPGVPSTSPYEVVDEVIQYLQMEYLNLKRIDVVGYSTGADIGLIWAVLSPNGHKNMTSGGVRLRILIGSPNVYLYLNDKRPAQDCNEQSRAGAVAVTQCKEFLVPGSSVGAAAPCPGYNRFPYGLDGLGRAGDVRNSLAAASSSYLHKYMDVEMAKAELPALFALKDVVFMVGTEDTDTCEESGACPSKVCGAAIQGKSRMQRGLNYMGHLREAIPGYEPQLRTFTGSPKPEHFFETSVWVDSAFGDIPGEPERGLSLATLFSSGFLALWFCLCFTGCTCLAGMLFGIYRNNGYTKSPESYEDFQEETEGSDEERQHDNGV